MIVSKNRLYQIFSELSDVREETEESKYPLTYSNTTGKSLEERQISITETKKIEYSGFLMGLIQVAQEIIEADLVPPQKLIMLLEKINEGRGYKRLVSMSLVQEVRKKYGKYYLNSFGKTDYKDP